MKSLNNRIFTIDNNLRSLLIALLLSAPGFEINLFNKLSICQLENKKYLVRDSGDEYIFDNVRESVDLFLRLRRDRQIGFDFEITSGNEVNVQLHIH
jgi:hypothetical protein